MKKRMNSLRDKLFTKIHMSNLVYNTCWEDPRIDRELLAFNEDSKVAMITSAGCNALDYSLDNPSAIHCIDMNYRQNALLELKKATIKNNDFEHHFKIFGKGANQETNSLYENRLRKMLPNYAQAYWDKKISDFFQSKKDKKTFYFRGTSGSFAWLFKQYFNSNKALRKAVTALINSKTYEEQIEAYNKLEPKLLSKAVIWVMNQHTTMAMLGVPRAQRNLIVEKYPNGMAGYLKNNLRHVFTELPIQDNYFWRLYIMGKYSKETCPEYVKEDNYEQLQSSIEHIKVHTNSFSGFLKENPDEYTHYILLDHQDWLANYNPNALAEEWKLILENSKPGTKILMRSAAAEINFFPEFVKERVQFDLEKGAQYHTKDRVGTYGSTYIGRVTA